MSDRSKVRPVQASLLPDVKPDRPIGAILGSVFRGSNADLMAAVSPYYLQGHVCDVTYGEGNWWRRFRPDPFTAHDLHKLDGVDFTNLPEDDDTYDGTCFDPAYVVPGGHATSTRPDFRDRYGLVGEGATHDGLVCLVRAGMAECARVTKPDGYVLAKCADYTVWHGFHLAHVAMVDAGLAAGLYVHDFIVHHTGPGPGGHNIFDPKRARRHHSYLIVFTGVEK